MKRNQARNGVRAAAFAACFWCAGVMPAIAQDGFDRNGTCVGDRDLNDQVTVDEIVTAVNNALDGCDLVPFEIQFQANVGDTEFQCGTTYEGIGSNGQPLTPEDFRFYVHGIKLIATDGREVPLRLEQDGIWQLEDLALLDFEDKSGPCSNGTVQTNTVVSGMAPPGEYNGVRFVLGVPLRLNHMPPETAPSPLTLTRLWWNWQAGYKFIRVDDMLNATRIHLGSTGCIANEEMTEVSSCARPNRPEVILRDFDPETNVIVADLAALFADSELNSNQPDTLPGCQSEPFDDDCMPIFTNLGLNFTNGMPDPSRQHFFRVE